jgi:L-threonylcarbamoyladenylate synthase
MPIASGSNPDECLMHGRIAPANADWIAEAGHLIRSGALVAFPTETVYGLGADATNSEAVARVFEAKGRPSFNPLIVHVLGLEAAEAIGVFTAAGRRLAEAFWPGPLTFVVPRRDGCNVSDLVSAGLPTVALRAPKHPVARALIEAAQRPIAAPSANRSGHVSATRAEHVAADLGDKVTVILDAGPTPHGVESTILDLTGESPVLLRPGAITVEDIERVIGGQVRRQSGARAVPTSPGQLKSHYAPRAALRLNAATWRPDEAVLAFGQIEQHPARMIVNLSPSGDLIEAAANLFAALRQLDASGARVIAVSPIPVHGLGEAINDRLQRAAAPRG